MKDKKKSKDLIFECRKCLHNLYVNPKGIKTLFKADCPNCGESAEGNWTLIGEGIYKPSLRS